MSGIVNGDEVERIVAVLQPLDARLLVGILAAVINRLVDDFDKPTFVEALSDLTLPSGEDE